LYSIGDVCRILSLKPHVLRYWEQEFPILSPKKDWNGHRIYSEGDLQILGRIKFLLYEKRYTIDGAREELWRLSEGAYSDLRLRLSLLRADLLAIKGILDQDNPSSAEQKKIADN